MSHFGQMKIKDLREELRKRGAKTTGKKGDLVERLESYEKNANFGQSVTLPHMDYTMEIPEATEYRDINSNTKIPTITQKQIRSFIAQYGTAGGEKASLLYKEKFIQYIRVAQAKENTFVQSRCHAEMRKAVSYLIDIEINKLGVIHKSQCECAAGMGPSAHCKHVLCVLFALEDFSSKKQVLLRETCTQKLQTFHHSKPYFGSPIKCKSLKLRKKSLRKKSLFDPRPVYCRNKPNYNSIFRNVVLNSCNNNAPIRQLYSPAQKHAIYDDHDYLKNHAEQIFLDQEEVTSIKSSRIFEIANKTVLQSNCQLWFDERRKRITSSNFGKICKSTQTTNLDKLARRLMFCKTFCSAAINYGKLYEQQARETYEKYTLNKVTSTGLCVSQLHPFLACSPDGLVQHDGSIEIKCPYTSRNYEISPSTVPYLEYCDGVLCLKNNHDYYYQIQGVLFCTGRKWCDFVVLSLKDFKVIHINRNDEFIYYMVMQLLHFFHLHFKRTMLNAILYHDEDKYSFVGEP